MEVAQLAKCIGFEQKKAGLKVNCANCKNWNGKCLVRNLLDELYQESPKFDAFSHMMRSNRGVRL